VEDRANLVGDREAFAEHPGRSALGAEHFEEGFYVPRRPGHGYPPIDRPPS